MSSYIIHPARWRRNYLHAKKSDKEYYHFKHLSCVVEGLQSSYSDFKSAIIDAYIAKLIVNFNELGYKTTYCCSGLKEHHTENHVWPYISFDCIVPLWLNLEAPFCLDGIHIIRGHNIKSNKIWPDEIYKKGWNYIIEQINEKMKGIV